MSSSDATPPLNYYPIYLFTFSPTYCRWSRLTAKDIHFALHQRVGFEGQDIWFYLNHPIKWVRVVGIVVAYDDLENRQVLKVDDGSGYTIDLVSWKTAPPGTDPQQYKPANLHGVELHSVVKVKGSVSEFRGTRQMLLKRITLLKDTNEEVAAWGETTAFKREILSKPWVASARIVEREKRKVDRGVEDKQLRERKRRKLGKMMKQERMVVEGSEKENITWETLVEKSDWESRQKEHREGGNKPETEHQSDTGYRGRRRPPNAKPPPQILPIPEPAKPEITDSISTGAFKGRRRAAQVPAAPIPAEVPREPESEPTSTYRGRRRVPKPPVDIPSPPPSTVVSTPPESEPAEILTYHGHRRTSKPLTALSNPVPPLIGGPVAEAPRYLASVPNAIKEENYVKVSSEESSTYRSRRRISKQRDVLTSRLVPELPDPVQLPWAESSTHRGQWRTSKASRDDLTSDPFPEELLKPVQLSSAESTFRGRRRTSKAPGYPHQPSLGETSTCSSQSRLEELASTLLTQSSEQCTSFRDLRRRLKAQRNTPEMQEINEQLGTSLEVDEKGGSPQLGKQVAMIADAPSLSSQVSGVSYLGNWWESNPPDIQTTLPSPLPSVFSTYVPSQSQEAENEERSLYREKGRGESQLELDTEELLEFSDFIPTPASQSTVVESSHRGGHKVSKVQTQVDTQELLELLEFSDFVPSPSQAFVSVKCSSFRGRRRNQPKDLIPYSSYPLGFLPPSENSSQSVSPVSQTVPQVSSSSYRGKRRG